MTSSGGLMPEAQRRLVQVWGADNQHMETTRTGQSDACANNMRVPPFRRDEHDAQKGDRRDAKVFTSANRGRLSDCAPLLKASKRLILVFRSKALADDRIQDFA